MNTKRMRARAIAWLYKKMNVLPVQYHQDEMARLTVHHAQEIAEEHRRVDDLIAKVAQLTWSRVGDVYKLDVAFDARIMYGYGTREDLGFVAKMIARQVEGEIASSRFIQKAVETERMYR